jgi:hypothetical protein
MFEICGDESIALYLNPPFSTFGKGGAKTISFSTFSRSNRKSGAKTLKKIQKIINNKTKY